MRTLSLSREDQFGWNKNDLKGSGIKCRWQMRCVTTLFVFNGQKHKEMELISNNLVVSDAAGKKLFWSAALS